MKLTMPQSYTETNIGMQLESNREHVLRSARWGLRFGSLALAILAAIIWSEGRPVRAAITLGISALFLGISIYLATKIPASDRPRQ